jgi:dienelactone hydrolase
LQARLLTALVLVAALAVPARAGTASPGVSRLELNLVDRSRATPANGSAPGEPTRRLTTVVSYPSGAKRPLPLVVFATGFGGTATNYAPLYDDWVRAGYVVAAPNFPLSGEDAPGGQTALDLPSQSGDVKFVVDDILRRSKAPKSKLHRIVDPKRVAIAGKSLGAITVLTAGYSPTERIPNLRAVIAMTGAATDDGTYFTGIDTPLLLLHGDADTTLPIDGSRGVYAKAEPPKFFVTLFGQTHGSAFEGDDSPAAVVVEKATTDFLDRYVKGEKPALSRLHNDADVPGVASLQAEE